MKQHVEQWREIHRKTVVSYVSHRCSSSSPLVSLLGLFAQWNRNAKHQRLSLLHVQGAKPSLFRRRFSRTNHVSLDSIVFVVGFVRVCRRRGEKECQTLERTIQEAKEKVSEIQRRVAQHQQTVSGIEATMNEIKVKCGRLGKVKRFRLDSLR